MPSTTSNQDRIFADRPPEARIFDVQRLEIQASSGGSLQRPASARILRPQSARTRRTADLNELGAGGGAEQVQAVHRSSDQLITSHFPPDGGGWTRSGRAMPPNRKRGNTQQQKQHAFKARPLPKPTVTAAEAAHAALLEATAEGERVVAARETGGKRLDTSSKMALGPQKGVEEIKSSQGIETPADNALLMPRHKDRGAAASAEVDFGKVTHVGDIQPWSTKR